MGMTRTYLLERLFGDVWAAQVNFIERHQNRRSLGYFKHLKQSKTYAIGYDFGPSTVPGFPQASR